MAHFPLLNKSRIGESSGRLANARPLWTMASWMSSVLVTITSVRWPICMLYKEIVEAMGVASHPQWGGSATPAIIFFFFSFFLFFFFKKKIIDLIFKIKLKIIIF
jgi:hypothetical protein